MAKKDTKHVIFDAVKQAIVCENCGEQESFRFPMGVDDFLKWSKGFMRKHRYCRDGHSDHIADAESLVSKMRVTGPTVDRLKGAVECP